MAAVTSGYFNMDRSMVMKDLDDNGYAVIPDVISGHDCDQYIDEYKQWLDDLDDVNPLKPISLIHGFNTGNLSTTWKARLRTKPVFATLWGTQKLLTSVDRIAISPPPEAGTTGEFNTGHVWFHVDHNSLRAGLHGYQGALYLEETTETDHCFRVMKGSHKYTDEFYETFKVIAKKRTRHVDHLTKEDRDWYQSKGCLPTKVPVPKGGMVLWDTRTVHDNCKPERGRPHSDRWRFAIFVSMGPAKWARPEDMVTKQKVYKDIKMTGHWPCQDIHIIDDVTPENVKQSAIPSIIPDVARTREARLLAGDLDYDFDDGEPNGPDWMPKWTSVEE